MKSDKNRAQIDFIKNLLNQNEKRATILDKFGQKWEKVSRTTFGRRMESAKAEVLEENKKKEEIRDSLLPEQVKAELEANIASETELDVVMSKIALAGIKVEEFIKGKPVVREVNPMEMIAAAEKLYKRKGSYGEKKVKHILEQGVKGFLLEG